MRNFKERGFASVASESLAELERTIQSQLRGRVRDFRMDVKTGRVALTGVTRSYYEKQLVQHAVMKSLDLAIESNDIVVLSQ